jgi:hypothetical protein
MQLERRQAKRQDGTNASRRGAKKPRVAGKGRRGKMLTHTSSKAIVAGTITIDPDHVRRSGERHGQQ